MTNKIWKICALGGMVACLLATIGFYALGNHEAAGMAVVAILAFWLSTSAAIKIDKAEADTLEMAGECEEAEDVVDTIWSKEDLQDKYAVELEKWIKDMGDFKSIKRHYDNHNITPTEEVRDLPNWIGFNYYPYGSELISLYVLLSKEMEYIITVEENEDALIEVMQPPTPEEGEEAIEHVVNRALVERLFLVTSLK